jgi:hypothetical protein
MQRVRRVVSCALLAAVMLIALLAGSATAARADSSLPGTTACEQFRSAWGPLYSYPGLNCP